MKKKGATKFLDLDELLFLSAVLLNLLTVSIPFFSADEKYVAFQIISVILLILSSAYSLIYKKSTTITANTIPPLVGLILMYFSHAAVTPILGAFIVLSAIYAILTPRAIIIKATRKILIVVPFLLVAQYFTYGINPYGNSEKYTLLFWNPNLFWHYISYFIIYLIYSTSEILIDVLVGYVALGYLYGIARAAALNIIVVLSLTSLDKYVSLKSSVVNFLIAAASFSLIIFVVFEADILYELRDMDDLLNNRISTASDMAIYGEMSDLPLHDVIAAGHPILFVFGLLICALTVRARRELILLFLISFSSDSTLYGSVSILYFFLIFTLCNDAKQKLKYKNLWSSVIV